MYFSAFCTRGVTYSLPTKYCSSLLWTEHDQEAWTSRSASQDCDGLCGHTWTYRNCSESSSLSRNSFLFHVRAQPSGDCSNKPGWAAARSQLPLRGTRAPSAIMPCLTTGERLRQHPSHTGPWVQQGAARWAAHTAPTHFPPPEALRQLSYQAGGRTAAEAHTQTWEQPAPQPGRPQPSGGWARTLPHVNAVISEKAFWAAARCAPWSGLLTHEHAIQLGKGNHGEELNWMTEKICAQKVAKTTPKGYAVLACLYSPENAKLYFHRP